MGWDDALLTGRCLAFVVEWRDSNDHGPRPRRGGGGDLPQSRMGDGRSAVRFRGSLEWSEFLRSCWGWNGDLHRLIFKTRIHAGTTSQWLPISLCRFLGERHLHAADLRVPGGDDLQQPERGPTGG